MSLFGLSQCQSLCQCQKLRLLTPIPKREPSCTIAKLPISNIRFEYIIPTQIVDPKEIRKPWLFPDVPICVVTFESKYIIADGNHRFQVDVRLKRGLIKAWVLRDGDQKNIDSNEKLGKMTSRLRKWKEGKISYRKMVDEMIKEAKKIGAL